MKMKQFSINDLPKRRLEIRKVIYQTIGTTYNQVELFLLNRFPKSHESYLKEWIRRLQKPNHMNYMDTETLQIWLAVSLYCAGHKLPKKLPKITGKAE